MTKASVRSAFRDPFRPVILTRRAPGALRFACAILAAGAFAAGCKDSTGSVTPASITADAIIAAEGSAGLVLTTIPTFTVRDAEGNVLGGVRVSISVTAGGGVLTDAPTETRSGGPTPIGTFKLGNTAGLNTITITVDGLPPLVINIIGRPGPPASIVFISGANQTALAGTSPPLPLVVQVRDQFGNPVPGVAVTFSVVTGGGTVSQIPVTTDASGNATAPGWVLGKVAFPQILRAAVGTITAQADAIILSSYTVDLRFFGPQPTDIASAAFVTAAARIRATIIGDIPDFFPSAAGINLEGCGVPGTILNEFVDDVVIYATIVPIDGPLRVLASAGPCFVRSGNGTTIVGSMRFDADDIQTLVDRGTLQDVVLHEMLHVVGIGTLWNRFGLLQGAGTPDTRYTGANGVAGCVAVGGASVCGAGSIPVEDTGGPGTADGHWRERVFRTELMTGFIGSTNPFSVMSIRSLSDLGLQVNTNAADPYTVPDPPAGARAAYSLDSQSEWEILMKPKYEVSSSGAIRELRAP